MRWKGMPVWPPFEPLKLPDSDLVKLLSQFMAGVGDSTEGKILGLVEPVLPEPEPLPDEEWIYKPTSACDAKLFLARRPMVSTLLFTATVGKDGGLSIGAWVEEIPNLFTMEHLLDFLEGMATSTHTKLRVQQLLALDAVYDRAKDLTEEWA